MTNGWQGIISPTNENCSRQATAEPIGETLRGSVGLLVVGQCQADLVDDFRIVLNIETFL